MGIWKLKRGAVGTLFNFQIPAKNVRTSHV